MTDMSHEALPQRHRERHAPKADHSEKEKEEDVPTLARDTEAKPDEAHVRDKAQDEGQSETQNDAQDKSADGASSTAVAVKAEGEAEEAASTVKGSELPPAPAKVHEGQQFEFLDHTADVQIHSWGRDITEAFEFTVLAMFNYCTDLATVEIDPEKTIEVEVQGHDIYSLLFSFMDEFLFHFSAEYFILKEVNIVEFDQSSFHIRARAWGERFTIGKHPQGTEIKAITFSNMQIWEDDEATQIYVIVDI
eukprot:GGOE01013841.1.p1 GENE.GGOE01013841.1~~GGOE01013841.1.p1  ORF type:complete len:249 (-),score=75.06 GGOE01013841.1:248-994(-)